MKLNIIMKKITLNETDPIKIVNKVLNEQDERQFDEDQIELLNFIFEREFKPQFTKGNKDNLDNYPYYNRDGEKIGWLDRYTGFMVLNPFWTNIKYKVCQVFEFPYNTSDWWYVIEPHIKYWMENQINVELDRIY